MSGVSHTTIYAADQDMRLDRWFLRAFPGLSFGQLSKLLRTGQIRVNGKRVKGGERLKAGDDIRIPPLNLDAAKPTKSKPDTLSKEDIAFIRDMVVYQDDEIIVLNKPAGLAVQGGTGMYRHVDALLPALKAKGDTETPKLVHRLDKDTSGLLVVARHARAARFLTRAFREKDCHKVYWALVRGVPKLREGKIDLGLTKGAAGGAREKTYIDEAGKKAVTYYKVLEYAGAEACWVALIPETGRTHQLRVHMAHIGHAIIGDGKYGGRDAHLGGLSGKLHLHAAALSLPHPKGGIKKLTAPLPQHMENSFQFLGFSVKEVTDPYPDPR